MISLLEDFAFWIHHRQTQRNLFVLYRAPNSYLTYLVGIALLPNSAGPSAKQTKAAACNVATKTLMSTKLRNITAELEVNKRRWNGEEKGNPKLQFVDACPSSRSCLTTAIACLPTTNDFGWVLVASH